VKLEMKKINENLYQHEVDRRFKLAQNHMICRGNKERITKRLVGAGIAEPTLH